MRISRRNLILIFSAAGVLLILAAVWLFGPFSAQRKYDRYFEEARLCYLERDWSGALTALDQALRQRDTEEGNLLMAEIYLSSGEPGKAVSTLFAASLRFDSKKIDDRLSELRAGQEENEKGDTVTVGGQTIAKDAKSLILIKKGLSSVDLSPLSELSALENLSLMDNSITDISVLSGLRKLSFLQLSGNRISDLTPLAGLTELKTLYLDGNPVEDLTPLYGLKKLRTLSLQDITIGSNKLDELQNALPDCNIFCNDVLQEAKEITLGGVSFKSDVTELNLAGLGLTDISALSDCAALTKLDLSNNNISDLTPLENMKSLTWLCLLNNKVENLTPLLFLPNLSYLDLDKNNFTNISALGGLVTLEELYISGNKPESFEPLVNLTKLKRLGLNDTGFADADLDAITGLTELAELRLKDNSDFTAGGLDKLKEALPGCNIEHSELFYIIMLGGREFRSDISSLNAESSGVTSLDGLEKFTSLKSLILNGNRLSDLRPIAELTALETLELSRNQIKDLSSLRNLSSLQRLTLGKNHISDISELAGLQNLTYLDLENNRISDLTPLFGLHKMRFLNIGKNSSLSAEQVVALQEALPDCIIQTDLDLSPPPFEPPPPARNTR